MEIKKIRTSKDIGGIIKKRRKELGISQEKLAEIRMSLTNKFSVMKMGPTGST
jgi:predicted transcriptional regulator